MRQICLNADTQRAPQARDRASAATGVSGRTVQTAKAIKENASDLAERVHAGKVSLHAAAKEVERRELAPIVKAQVERDRRELQELADEINPPGFDPVENADQVPSAAASALNPRDGSGCS